LEKSGPSLIRTDDLLCVRQTL